MNIRQLVLGALGTNCYIVWDDEKKAVVIDPACYPDRILAVIKEEGLEVTSVVLTHAHFDHMEGAQGVCEATDAPLCVGAGDAPAVADPSRNLSARLMAKRMVSLTPDRILREGDTLTVGSMSFTVWETPGHTPGCICLVGEDVVFSGDTLFCGSIGRTDFPGGDDMAMLRSLRRLATLPQDMAVYSGHGPATTIGQEIRTNPYMR